MAETLEGKNILTENGNVFAAAAKNFNLLSFALKSESELIDNALEVYLKFPGCNSVSIFKLDSSSFTFDHIKTKSAADAGQADAFFNLLVEEGAVAEALAKMEITERECCGKPGEKFLLIPLAASDGVLGMVILKLSARNVNPEDSILCGMFSDYFALRLNEDKLKSNLAGLVESSELRLETRTEEIIQSTRELKTILDSVLTGIIMVDKNTNEIIDANVAAAELIGENKESIIGSNRKKYFFNPKKTNPNEIVTNQEGLLKRSDGKLIPIIRNTANIRLGGDECFLESFIDISARKEMENELQKARFELERRVEERTMLLAETNDELLRQIDERVKAEEEKVKLYLAVQQSPTAILITDLEGGIEYINPKFTKITGYEFHEVEGRKPGILKSGEIPPEGYSDLWKAITEGSEWRGEFRNKKKSGELYWVSATILPIFNIHGEITNYLAVEEDITEKKNFEKQLIAAKIRAEESDRLKSTLLANMSHEFRTPLIGILGFSQFLQSELKEPDYVDMLNDINISGKRLLNTLDGVLQLAQMEAISSLKEKTRINLAVELNKRFFNYYSVAKEKNLNFSINADEDKLFVLVDPDLLSKSVAHLLDNAIKFTNAGSVELSARREKSNEEIDCIIIEVKDTGIGISPENHKIVFEAFRQASEGYSRSYEGCGLGLTIAQKMISLMDGKIDLESEPGKGSVFTVRLPACS